MKQKRGANAMGSHDMVYSKKDINPIEDIKEHFLLVATKLSKTNKNLNKKETLSLDDEKNLRLIELYSGLAAKLSILGMSEKDMQLIEQEKKSSRSGEMYTEIIFASQKQGG